MLFSKRFSSHFSMLFMLSWLASRAILSPSSENADCDKISVSPRREHDFQGFEELNIIKHSSKIYAKSMTCKDVKKKRENTPVLVHKFLANDIKNPRNPIWKSPNPVRKCNNPGLKSSLGNLCSQVEQICCDSGLEWMVEVVPTGKGESSQI